MRFSEFASHLTLLETESKRLKITEILAGLLSSLDEDEVRVACYLLQGRLVPTYISLEFVIAAEMVQKTLARLVDVNKEIDQLNYVKKMYKELGDLGKVTVAVLEEMGQGVGYEKAVLSVREVHQKLSELAADSGSGSQERKIVALAELLAQLDAEGAKYVVRIVLGRLRLGFSDKTLLDALSWAVVGDKSESTMLELAYSQRADSGVLAEIYLQKELRNSSDDRRKAVEAITLSVGIPMMPSLCQRLETTQEMIDKMGEVFAEPKYDGLRIQIHIDKSAERKVIAFTRTLDDVTHMFPELEKIVDGVAAATCVLDGEAIGVDPHTQKLLAFQQTITRRRKHNVAQLASDIPMRFYIFDCLLVDGTPIIDKKLQERKDVLKNLIKENEYLVVAPYITTTSAQKLRSFHEEQLEQGLEGMVVKKVSAPYQSGRKAFYWVKIKEEEGTSGKLSDTLDLVVMGYYSGKGKRTQFGMGALLAGVLQGDTIVSITKIGTGMSEDQLVDLKSRCDALVSEAQPSTMQVHADLAPDVWVKPGLVVEVAADEITISPKHTAGIALRFPRLISIRDDKSWQQATTLGEAKTIGKIS